MRSLVVNAAPLLKMGCSLAVSVTAYSMVEPTSTPGKETTSVFPPGYRGALATHPASITLISSGLTVRTVPSFCVTRAYSSVAVSHAGL